jgi:hypothetical protein
MDGSEHAACHGVFEGDVGEGEECVVDGGRGGV